MCQVAAKQVAGSLVHGHLSGTAAFAVVAIRALTLLSNSYIQHESAVVQLGLGTMFTVQHPARPIQALVASLLRLTRLPRRGWLQVLGRESLLKQASTAAKIRVAAHWLVAVTVCRVVSANSLTGLPGKS